MNAKIFIKLMVVLVVALTSISATADSGSSQNSTHRGKGSAMLDLQYKSPNTKRAPSRKHLEVVYMDGAVTLLSQTYNGEFSLTFENCETGESVVIPSIFVGESINIELPCGIYNVSVTGSDGLSFYGFLEIS
ncbi:MAG: hypothetical protein K2L45_11455 [Muribaculaceae bacterium]|nr:hypothetical protein [Muribaculaceae bacterium]